MYDISQLNDMLVPELLDIADQLSIPHAKKLEKQDLIYKIVDGRLKALPTETKEAAPEKARRKRIVKANTGNTTEEAEVMSGDSTPKPEEPADQPTAAPAIDPGAPKEKSRLSVKT